MQLPLFPLNSVLFPGMPLRLHIFEDRYKEMINECVDNKTPFGVVLINVGSAEGGPVAKPYMVGTTAHITQVQRLPYGRLNILAVGRERFKINALDASSRSFLQGDVDMLPLISMNQATLTNGAKKLSPLLQRYLTSLSDAGQVQFDNEQLPDDPMALIYLSAMLLQSEDDVKQDILESVDTYELLKKLLRIYHKEVALIDILLSPPQLEQDNDTPFSLS
ncbi:MAG: LON peptidase substrate-binding domain-containing protein [Phototrophicaceae bacterium]